MLKENAGNAAGLVWHALNENGTMTVKGLKKVTKVKTEKEIYLALGWLLREDKIVTGEAEKEITVTLK